MLRCSATRELLHSPFGDNNLVPIHLWLREIVENCEKVFKYSVHDCCQRFMMTLFCRNSKPHFSEDVPLLLLQNDQWLELTIWLLGPTSSPEQPLFRLRLIAKRCAGDKVVSSHQVKKFLNRVSWTGYLWSLRTRLCSIKASMHHGT